MTGYFDIRAGQDMPQMLANDFALERDAIERFNRAVAVAREVDDNGSRHVLEETLREEEGHAGSIEAQLTQLEQMGKESYLANQVRE